MTPKPGPQRVPVGSVVAYVVIACALAWIVCLPLYLSGDGLAYPHAQLLLVLMMFTPTVAMLIVVLAVQRPSRPLEYLGIWPLRPAGRTVGMTVIAIVGMILVVVAGVLIAGAFGAVRLDVLHFSGFAEMLRQAAPGVSMPPAALLVVIQLLTLPLIAVFNGLTAVGEELGWRGWLLPSLRPLGTWPALLITGAVWGLWHAPIILLGYNFAQPNLFGVLLMVVGCVFVGVLIGWLRLRTASVWPSVFAHGALNAAGPAVLPLLLAASASPHPVAAGPLGWGAWIAFGVVAVVLLAVGQFSRQPRLQRSAPRPRRAANVG